MEQVEAYIRAQQVEFQDLLWKTRELILEEVPRVEEYYKYKTPFYHLFGKPFCYLTVPKQQACVELAFIGGKFLEPLPDLPWRAVERKQVRSVEVSEPFPQEALKFLLQEAALLQETKPGWDGIHKKRRKS